MKFSALTNIQSVNGVAAAFVKPEEQDDYEIWKSVVRNIAVGKVTNIDDVFSNHTIYLFNSGWSPQYFFDNVFGGFADKFPISVTVTF